jgi:hypothetical protein
MRAERLRVRRARPQKGAELAKVVFEPGRRNDFELGDGGDKADEAFQNPADRHPAARKQTCEPEKEIGIMRLRRCRRGERFGSGLPILGRPSGPFARCSG